MIEILGATAPKYKSWGKDLVTVALSLEKITSPFCKPGKGFVKWLARKHACTPGGMDVHSSIKKKKKFHLKLAIWWRESDAWFCSHCFSCYIF